MALARRWLPLLREHFGAHLRALDDEALLAHTIEGIKRGKGHDLEMEEDLYRFAIVRIALGDAFDRDPALPWAAQLLRPQSRPAGARMKELVARAIELLRERP